MLTSCHLLQLKECVYLIGNTWFRNQSLFRCGVKRLALFLRSCTSICSQCSLQLHAHISFMLISKRNILKPGSVLCFVELNSSLCQISKPYFLAVFPQQKHIFCIRVKLENSFDVYMRPRQWGLGWLR